MHETGIVRDMVRRLEAAARDAGTTRVAGIAVRIGALSRFSLEHFREHFDEEVRGKLAEGAALRIRTSGDVIDAREMFGRLLSLRNDVGLLAEKYDPSGKRQLGNSRTHSHISH